MDRILVSLRKASSQDSSLEDEKGSKERRQTIFFTLLTPSEIIQMRKNLAMTSAWKKGCEVLQSLVEKEEPEF